MLGVISSYVQVGDLAVYASICRLRLVPIVPIVSLVPFISLVGRRVGRVGRGRGVVG